MDLKSHERKLLVDFGFEISFIFDSFLTRDAIQLTMFPEQTKIQKFKFACD